MTKQKYNIYSNKRQAITYSAGRIYTASKGGFPIDSSQQDSTSHYDLGDGSAKDLDKARKSDIETNSAVKNVLRLAILKDRIDNGGIRGIAARVELVLNGIAEPQNTKNAGPIVENIRGNHQQ